MTIRELDSGVAVRVAASLLAMVGVGCLRTTASCVERDPPDNTCYVDPVNQEGCEKTPGCTIGPMCEALGCVGAATGEPWDGGASCYQSEHEICAVLANEECASNPLCTWALGCTGKPTVNCASIRTDHECMAYPVCFWQISGG